MQTPTAWGSRLLQFLLLLAVRLGGSFGRVALALRARFASLWRSILTFGRRKGQSQTRLHANNVPTANTINPMGERPQASEPAKVEEENRGTLATLPVRSSADWRDGLSSYLTMISSHEFKFEPLPATPEGGSERYKPRGFSQSDRLSGIPAGQKTLLTALPSLPDGWARYVHPEGNAFYYHERLRVFTESDVAHYEKEIIFYATTLIQRAIETDDVDLDELTEIVLNVHEDQSWRYYFVDHRHRLLFWVDRVELQEDLGIDLQGVSGYSHIRYLVEARYWYVLDDMVSRTHCEYYPHNRTLPNGVFEDLRGMLNYSKTDMMTADSSTSPFAQDELVAILDLVNSLKDDKEISNSYSIWAIARVMASFTDNRFLNFCGQPCARLNADTPLFGQQTWNRGLPFKVLNLFLFFSLNEHAVRLLRVWVDGVIIQPRWKDFINRLTSELGRYTIFSTVMLAVNISFLAVPGVITPGAPASRTQIVIYCSVVSTIGSIVFSLALLNVYSDPRLGGASPAAEVMKTLTQKNLGMARFAIMHSLPNACLKWSIILFSAALAIQIFSPKEHPTVATLSAECAILVLFGLMSMRIVWLFSQDTDLDGVDDDVGGDGENEPPAGLRPDVEGICGIFYRR